MKSKRKFSSDFKTKVVLESLKEHYTVEQLAVKYELAPAQIHHWKKLFLERCSLVFEDKSTKEVQDNADHLKELYAKIGELNMVNDWLKKKLQ